MEHIQPMKALKIASLALSAIMLVTFLVPAPAAEASAFSGPCPQYSIQNVFDDPGGNWDGDQMNNSDELYNGLNPCQVDTDNFCAGGGNPLCTYYTYVYTGYPTACQLSINAYPHGDYDGDGISNSVELRNYANPCTHPCPYPTNADLALNPNGSWDNDGISNALEVNQGTDPCTGNVYNPCPYYTHYQARSMGAYDWDGDGVTNADELARGTNPCRYNRVVYHTTTVQRLPHVNTTYTPRVYVAPKPPVPVCPYGYPYYHPGTNLCYANPVKYF